MKIVFWQNIISPHQVDLLKALSSFADVTLVVQEEIDSQRKRQNWATTVPADISLVISPSLKYIKSKIQAENTVHIISGFFAYKISNKVLFYSKLFRKKVFIMSEAVESQSFKGKIKLAIRQQLCKLFKNEVQGVFATGNRAKDYFKKLGFTEKRLFDFGYFVDVYPTVQHENDSETEIKSLIYVGRLVEYKGVQQLIQALSLIIENDPTYHLEIVGSGPLELKLKKMAEHLAIPTENIVFTKDIPRNDVLLKIENADLLTLPNVSEEGWGAVVNEALLLGTPVLCSKYTGANVILREAIQGKVIEQTEPSHIAETILKLKPYIRNKVAGDSAQRLLPRVVAKNMIEVLKGSEKIDSSWV